MDIKYLVVGTGRCGTVYLAKFLSSIGIKCAHERIFNRRTTFKSLDDGIVGVNSKASIRAGLPYVDTRDFVPGESSYMAAPFLRHHCLKNTKIIHVIRHPLDVIRSFVLDFNYFKYKGDPTDEYELFILRNIPGIVQYDDPFVRACYFYVTWNKMISYQRLENDYKLFRIEDDPIELFEFLDMPVNINYFKDDRCNSEDKGFSIDIDDIPDSRPKDEMLAFAKEYYPNDTRGIKTMLL